MICGSCLWDGLTDNLTPWRCISRMHAMSQMSRVIDWIPNCLSERSLLSICSRGGETGTECLVSTRSHFGCTILPLCPPGCVMSWVVVHVAHVTPCDIRLRQCCQSWPNALSWTLGPPNAGQHLSFEACWHWMMCLFIMADRCHARPTLSPCKVSLAIFSHSNSAVDQSEDAVIGKMYDYRKWEN